MPRPSASSTDRLLAGTLLRLEGLAPKGPALTRALHRIGMLLEAKIKASIIQKELVDYGRLLNSIRYEVKETPEGGEVVVGSYGVKYARIHEFGGTIYPVKARALTIPVAPWAKDHSARDFRLVRIGSLLVDPARIRNLPEGAPIPQNAIGFRLAKKATIRPKGYMRDGIEQAKPRVIQILRDLEAQS